MQCAQADIAEKVSDNLVSLAYLPDEVNKLKTTVTTSNLSNSSITFPVSNPDDSRAHITAAAV